MFDNLTPSLQAEIIDLYAWMDAGTVGIKLATKDNAHFQLLPE